MEKQQEASRPKCVIERDIPGAGKLSAAELKAIPRMSRGVLSKLGPLIQWVRSQAAHEKSYCVYIPPNEEMAREHASQGGLPASSVAQVMTVIDPTTAE